MSGTSESGSSQSRDGTVWAKKAQKLIGDLTPLSLPWITASKEAPSVRTWQHDTENLLCWFERVHRTLEQTLDGIRERLAWADYERAKSFVDPQRREVLQTEISSLEGKREAYAPLKASSSKIVGALRVTIDPRHRQELKMPAAISQACTELEEDYYRPPSDAFLGLARSLATSLWLTLLEQECSRESIGLPDGTQISAGSSGPATE